MRHNARAAGLPAPAFFRFAMTSSLAPWASRPGLSRGRRYPQPPAPTRSEFQRDRDRIVHSSAFRRLVYKTQVFVNHEGDMFRTRLTHSLEVAQLARAIARALNLEEDLAEAIALAHDLGHTPFGHAGQDALNACMAAHGGFEHNLQSLRVVDVLEQRYPDYDGLNLCFETREGILKHCSPSNARRIEQAEPGGVARRFLDGTQPSLEAQLTNLADEIAYNAHDLDDGVRSGLLTLEQVAAEPLAARFHAQALAEHPRLQGRRLLYETIRRMLSEQVYDVIRHTRAALAEAAPASADAARAAPAPPPRRWCALAATCARNPPRSNAFSSPTSTATRKWKQPCRPPARSCGSCLPPTAPTPRRCPPASPPARNASAPWPISSPA